MMYQMKPVFSLSGNVSPAKVLFEMHNINEVRRGQEHTITDVENQAPHPKVAALETRQEKILGQLAELKDIISNLRNVVNQNNRSLSLSEAMAQKNKEPVFVDLIIRTDRKNVPYSLLAASRMWKDTKFSISCYSHSNDKSSVQESMDFEKLLRSSDCCTNEDNAGKADGRNVVNLTLIWKNVNDLEMIFDLSRNAVLGETNLLRYLSRTIENDNYEITVTKAAAVDKVLDLCHLLRHAKSNKECIDILKEFEDCIKTGNSWLIGTPNPSIADFAVWSVIKGRCIDGLPKNVLCWYKRCQKTFV